MKKLYSGKTKDVFLTEDDNILLHFKDSVTGTGDLVDSGGNQVVGEIEGKGSASLDLTVHFFELFIRHGLPTHYLGTGSSPDTLIVKKAESFQIEVVVRILAWGSFVRRYGKYIKEGTPLNYLVEFTLKDDDKEDPLITEDALSSLEIVTKGEVQYMKDTAIKAAKIVEANLKEKGLTLIDIKFEFGLVDGVVVIIDEVSGDTMRAVKDGEVLTQRDLAQEIKG